MGKITFKILLFSFLLLFISCNDDEPTYEKKAVDNIELIEALKTKGLSFEGNLIVLNDKVAEIKSLDLSGSKLTTISGLEIFPNIEEVNLSNNNFGTKFDFAKLPKSIKKVNLSENQIYDFQGLAIVNFEAADIKILREFEHITLPASARFNMETLPHYSKQSKTTKLSMQNAKTGKAEPYSTLREIPDNELRKYFNEQFSSIMTQEGKVDISKKISTEQETTDIVFTQNEEKIIEGFEYIINSPFYKGTMTYLIGKPGEGMELAYLKPGKTLEVFGFSHINTPVIDWSNGEHLRSIGMFKNNSIKEIDLSNSKYFMQKSGGYNQDDYVVDAIISYNCPLLQDIKLPNVAPMPIAFIELYDLPTLNSFNIKNINGIYRLHLADLPALKELSLKQIKHIVDTNGGKLDEPNSKISLSITEDILSIKGVQQFITEFGSKDKLSNWNQLESSLYEYGSPYKGKSYNYTKLYKVETKSTAKKEKSAEFTSFEDLIREIAKRQNK